jgi:NADPH:quinone reductase-like Zn-dependent oxidoreductase
MKAIVQVKYGAPEDLRLQEVDPPPVGDEDVLVRVRAASLHPDVWHVVSGRPYVLRLMGAGLLKPAKPIPGTDMAGVVEAIGRRVVRFKPGEAVFGETSEAHQWINGGSLAELVAVPQHLLALKPDHVTFEQAAAVPTSGYIALLNLRDPTRFGPGQRVLINGAGGGVGSLTLQIAKAYGAHVTAVDSTGKQELLRRLGADRVIDFSREDCTRLGDRYDLIIDVPGSRPFRHFRRALAPDGRYIPIGHDAYGASGRRVFGLLPHFLTLTFMGRFVRHLRGLRVPVPGKAETTAILRELLEAGRVTPLIDSTYPLGETRQALRHMMSDELRGKVIILVTR